MRVFYDHQVTSLQDAGGISRYFYELAQYLLRTGEVEPDLLLGLENSVVPLSNLPPPARVLSTATKLPPGYPRYMLNEALTACIAPFRGEYDVYHSTYQRILPWVRRSVVVVTHHDATIDRYPQLFPDAASIHARLGRLYAAADRILCISESSRHDLLHYYSVDPAKTEVIYHGFSPLAAPTEAETESIAGPFHEAPFLLYVGARASYKNFTLTLSALAQQDTSLGLLVMGGGPFTGEERRQIRDLRLGSRIHLVPRATDRQLAAAYRAATLFIYPSLYEGFGFPPLEAMHAGCPAVVSQSSALPEICGDAAFYFNPESATELARLIAALLDNPALRLSKQETGFAQVSRYTWEKTATATLAAYRTALEQSRKSSS